jgi:O-antigen ligase
MGGEGFETRRGILENGVRAFLQDPIVGVGLGAFGAATTGALAKDIVAHNTFLSVLVETGIVGGVAFLAILLALILMTRRMPVLERRVWRVWPAHLGDRRLHSDLGVIARWTWVLFRADHRAGHGLASGAYRGTDTDRRGEARRARRTRVGDADA